jgi:tetratricopeptide (TPR) repeat protein
VFGFNILKFKRSKMKLQELLKKNREYITTLIGTVISIFTLIQTIQGKAGDATLILLAIGVCVLWGNFFYIYFKKEASSLVLPATGKSSEKKIFSYSRKARRFAFGGIIVLPLICLVSSGVWFHIKSKPSDKFLILVCDFDGPEQKNYRVTEIIIEQLREAVKKYPEVEVQALNKPVNAQDGSQTAWVLGKENKASLVLWGWYGKTDQNAQVTIHIERLIEPRYISFENHQQTFNIPVEKFNSFQFQFQVSNGMNCVSLLILGLARYEAKDYKGASERLKDAINEASKTDGLVNPAIIHLFLGYTNLLNNDTDNAVLNFEKAALLTPLLPSANFGTGLAYIKKGDYKKGVESLNKAITLKNDDADLYGLRGMTFYMMGDFENAIADFDKSLTLDPNDSSIYYCRGVAFLDRGSNEQAISEFDKSLSLNSSDENSYINRGVAYRRIGEYERAITDFNKVLEINPTSTKAYNNRGNAYSSKGNYSFALEDFNEAIRINPNYPQAYNNRGNTYRQLGNYDAAISDFKQALSMNSNFSEVYINYGAACEESGDKECALIYFNKALEFPQSKDIRDTINTHIQSLSNK